MRPGGAFPFSFRLRRGQSPGRRDGALRGAVFRVGGGQSGGERHPGAPFAHVVSTRTASTWQPNA